MKIYCYRIYIRILWIPSFFTSPLDRIRKKINWWTSQWGLFLNYLIFNLDFVHRQYYNIKMKKKLSDGIFIEQKNLEKGSQISREALNIPTVPYLKRGDSSIYINQFLTKQEQPVQIKPEIHLTTVVVELPKQENRQSESSNSEQNRNQIKSNPSAFHNFQKHLTVALKHAVALPNEDKIAKEYLKAASKLWKVFTASKVCTKKVLHFLLGDKNEHKTTAQDLRQFGFSKIYDSFGDKIIREARIFLLQQTLRQIKQGCLEVYFQHKKIKDKQKFKKYVQIFVEQLQQGFLKKRLPRQKVAELIAE